ncbi:MAG: DUF2779 domain-containing protein [DPANN group archaeon]|nr:DUF2779 domain-containing protein [DPANN group archaeon]
MKYLSKSNYVIGLKCLRHLWLAFNEPDKLPDIAETTKQRFEQGHIIGKLAQTLFPGGVDAQLPNQFLESIERTKKLLAQRKILYEPAIAVGRLYARADILLPVNKDEWDIVEVKSSAKVKEDHLHDLSFQKYCCGNAGLKIRKCFLMHINNKYIRNGEVEPEKLFVKEDVTDDAEKAGKGIKDRIEMMLKVVERKSAPSVKDERCCKGPSHCDIGCWDFLPDNNIFYLQRIGEKAFELFDTGVINIKDIPENYELNDKQAIQRKCAKTGQPHIEKENIKKFLAKLKYPISFLDFETYSTAIPLYDGLRPYQTVPFQFSMHIIEKENGKPKHISYLAEGSEDPRKEFLEKLKAGLPESGSVIVYYKSFEQGRIEELTELFPKYKSWAESAIKRMADLIIPFTEFYYYNSKQEGSASLKAVLPALTGKSYKGLDIGEGETASLSYVYITHGADGKKATPDEVKKIRKDLEIYCGQDTEGMIWILDELRKLA